MENKTLHLLILEDNPDDAELEVKELEREGFTVKWRRVETEKAFRKALAEKPDLILADYSLPSYDGLAALQIRQGTVPEIPLMEDVELSIRFLGVGKTVFLWGGVVVDNYKWNSGSFMRFIKVMYLLILFMLRRFRRSVETKDLYQTKKQPHKNTM